MYSLIENDTNTHQILFSICTSVKLGIYKYIKNQILADLYFSALCLNSQYRQNSVTAKY